MKTKIREIATKTQVKKDRKNTKTVIRTVQMITIPMKIMTMVEMMKTEIMIIIQEVDKDHHLVEMEDMVEIMVMMIKTMITKITIIIIKIIIHQTIKKKKQMTKTKTKILTNLIANHKTFLEMVILFLTSPNTKRMKEKYHQVFHQIYQMQMYIQVKQMQN